MPDKNNKPERKTLSNFVTMLSSGQFTEILKVLRRRFINSLKFLRRIFLLFWFKLYDYPPLLIKRQKRQLADALKKYYSYEGPRTTAPLRVGLIFQAGLTHPKSSAFIRLVGPLTHPSVSQSISIELLPENTTEVKPDLDLFIVQRTAYSSKNVAIEFLQNLRSAGKKLVVDKDDAFGAIDAAHPEQAKQLSRIEALNYLLQNADSVWLSTENLKAHLPVTNNQVITIENTLDQRVWQKPLHKLAGSNVLQLLYMGTGTHDADLAMIVPILDAINDTNPDSFKLTVIGVASDLPERNWLARRHVRRSRTLYPTFVTWFLKQGPFDVGLSPLIDNSFNNAKSDIKCLDYLAAGILPVVSDLMPYQTKGLDDAIIKVRNTPADWQTTLAKLISNPGQTRQEAAEKIARGQRYVLDQRSSEIAAKKMLEQLKRIANKT